MTREEKQKAIDALKISAPVMAVTQEEFNDYIHILNHVMNWLEQEPKTGHWILKIEDWNKWTCSECGYTERTDIHVSLGYDFCPKCGAKMEGGQE